MTRLTAGDTDIAAKLATARQRDGLTVAAAAQRLGTSAAAVSRWEQRTAVPSPAQTKAIERWHNSGAPSQARNPFVSRGLVRQDDGDGVRLEFTDEPGPRILSRLVDNDFIRSAGAPQLEEILARHPIAAPSASRPPSGGMSAGKNTYTYDAHTYHTKVPPQGIAELLRHYLPTGGLVLDPFAGSGMTGVAASASGMDCILNELSPAASFIASQFTSKVDPQAYAAAVAHVVESTRDVRRDLYTTSCRECGSSTELLYTVWSYRVACYCCHADFQLWDHCRSYGRTVRDHKILSQFPCPRCGELLRKSRLPRTIAEPVQIGYKCCGSRQKEVTHPPSSADLEVIERTSHVPPLAAVDVPVCELPDGVNLSQPKKHGLTTVDRLYTARNFAALSHIWRAIHCCADDQIAGQLAFTFTSLYRRVTRLSEFRFWGGSGNTARLNVPYIFDEANVFCSFERKARTIQDHLQTTAKSFSGAVVTRIGSATRLDMLPDESVDLVFTDPPFGANINYSDMNFLWESWLGRTTDTTEEAIVNRMQGKGVDEYAKLLQSSLSEAYRVLRAGRWMLLVFMNSSAEVWAAIRAAVDEAGFTLVSADVFDKHHGTFKQFVSPNTTGADLVLHCLKPAGPVATKADSTCESLDKFLASIDLTRYVQPFLHVARPSEMDFRRLYSEWISMSVANGSDAFLDFAEFRQQVMRHVGSETPGAL